MGKGLLTTLFFALCGCAFFQGNGSCQEKVVVVPLGGSVGTAVADDVLSGKTFSNSGAEGLVGNRPPAPTAATGQVTTYRPGDDGTYQMGETKLPRWTAGRVFGFGTIDNLTGLIWSPSGLDMDVDLWQEAVDHCEAKSTGLLVTFTDWRLPTIKELMSLVDYGRNSPALPAGHPFTNVPSTGWYWSSTTSNRDQAKAYVLRFEDGDVLLFGKPGDVAYTWCVRGGK